jgi:hypothetical protein
MSRRTVQRILAGLTLAAALALLPPRVEAREIQWHRGVAGWWDQVWEWVAGWWGEEVAAEDRGPVEKIGPMIDPNGLNPPPSGESSDPTDPDGSGEIGPMIDPDG